MNIKRKTVTALALMMIAAVLVSGCSTDEQPAFSQGTEAPQATEPVPEAPIGTITVGIPVLSGTFSPFYAVKDTDKTVLSQIIESPLRYNSNQELKEHAGSITTDTVELDGTTRIRYTVALKPDMTFSDGEPVTIDDYLFSLYTLADPSYVGSCTELRNMEILGLKEYYYDTNDTGAFEKKMNAEIDKLVKGANDDGLKQWMRDSNLAGWWDGSLPGNINGDGSSWSDYIAGCGMDISDLAVDDANAVFEKLLECEFEYYKEDYMVKYKEELAAGRRQELLMESIAEGVEVSAISGITRTDDYTCEILVSASHVEDAETLGLLPIVPSHYYGSGEVVKGDLSQMHAKGDAPMGSGPYIWNGYSDFRVTLTANPSYYKGEPANAGLVFQEMNKSQMVDALLAAAVDVVTVEATVEAFEKCEQGQAYYYVTPADSYQYIGINADAVSDKSLRKGLLSLIDKESIVSSVFGGVRDNLQYPLPGNLAEYPENAENPYPFNVEQAMVYFEEAGYKKDKDGRLMKNKEQLTIDLGVIDSSTNLLMPLINQIKGTLESMGAVCNLVEYKSRILWDTGDKQVLDMWLGTMTGVTDCNLNHAFDIEDNFFGLKDKALKEKIDAANASLNVEERKALLLDALTLLMDKAVVLPVCQDSDMTIYHTGRIDVEAFSAEEICEYYQLKVK